MKHWCLTFCLVIASLFGSVGEGFASDLPPCVESAPVWNNCFGTWRDGKGIKYVSEWKNNKQHGQGTAIYSAPHRSAGEKYVGEYKDGKRSGQGTYTYANGNKYVGEYRYDKRHGQGAYTFASGSKYVGEYKDDKTNSRVPPLFHLDEGFHPFAVPSTLQYQQQIE